MLINEITVNATGYEHAKGSHEHFFEYTEQNLLNLLDRFSGKNFKINRDLFEVYHEVKHMEQQKHKYVPGIYDMQLKNVCDKAHELMKIDLGEFSQVVLGNLSGIRSFGDSTQQGAERFTKLLTSFLHLHNCCQIHLLLYQCQPYPFLF